MIDDILEEIKNEREHQDQKWGGPNHDDSHHLWEFAEWALQRARTISINSRPGFDSSKNFSQFRRLFIEIAALAVAAIESIDRRG
jgi:Mg/Co/Ni transporter MgtE